MESGIYRDHEEIPTGPWRIVIGTPNENLYLAQNPHPVDEVFAKTYPRAGGVWRLRPDRHLLLYGWENFYVELAGRDVPIPVDADFQVWKEHGDSWRPVAEGEFDNTWSL